MKATLPVGPDEKRSMLEAAAFCLLRGQPIGAATGKALAALLYRVLDGEDARKVFGGIKANRRPPMDDRNTWIAYDFLLLRPTVKSNMEAYLEIGEQWGDLSTSSVQELVEKHRAVAEGLIERLEIWRQMGLEDDCLALYAAQRAQHLPEKSAK